MEPRRQNQCIWSVLGVIIGPIFVIYGILSPNQKVLYSGLVIFIFSMIGFETISKTAQISENQENTAKELDVIINQFQI